MMGPKLSPLGNGVPPSPVHITVRVLLLYIIPFCGITEQITVRDSPANATVTLLKGFILTTGGEGTAMKVYTYMYV